VKVFARLPFNMGYLLEESRGKLERKVEMFDKNLRSAYDILSVA